MLVIPLLIAGFVWSQRLAIADFFSEVKQTAEAPVAKTFDEVAGAADVENVKVVENVDVAVGAEVVDSDVSTQTAETNSTPTTSNQPSEFNLAVPFTSQAPLSVWDVVHEDTCEEAVIYMVNEFYEGGPAGKIDPNVAEADLLKIVEFEKVLFGFFESTTAAQISVLAEQMYGYERVGVFENPTIEEIKEHLVAGRPVIVPTAGRMLGNPNFTGEGPLYHALVLKGYTETKFVTNDPGTRLGADYQYTFETVMNAMHDWNGGDPVNGAKVIVVIYPNSD